MAGEQDDVVVPENSLSYSCSNCGRTGTYFQIFRHVASNAECKAENATVVTTMNGNKASAEVVQKVKEKIEEAEAEPEVRSMAEQAAEQPLADWANRLVPVIPDEDEEPGEIEDRVYREVQPLQIKTNQADLNIIPRIWLTAAFEAFRGEGYEGSLTDFVHDQIEQLFAILGIKITIMDISPVQRERALESAGLTDGRS